MPSRRRPRAIRPGQVAERATIRVSTPLALLLDTHAFLWFVSGSEQLSALARTAIEHPAGTRYVSAASAWEIAIKRQQGKLPASVRFTPSLSGYLRRHGFTELLISADHAEAAGALPLHHRDPFDRMLIAQARLEDLELVSNDALFDAYAIRRLW